VGLAARRLARACPAASLAQIEARVEELKLLAQQEDAEAATRYVRVSQDLSFLICVGTGSEQLTSIVYSLFHQTIRYTRLSLSTLERRRYSSKVWAELIVAIRSGNEIEAETTARLLVDKTREMAIEMLRNSAAPA
jgi:DNA-binding GntR family transcriptional regulator